MAPRCRQPTDQACSDPRRRGDVLADSGLCGLHPRLILRVPELPATHDGKFSISRARAIIRDAAGLERPDALRPVQRSNRDQIWEHLVGLAADEQALLGEVLGILMATPELEHRVTKALGYPDWPMPLTLLPQLDPQLATAHPDLENYLTFWETAAAHVLVAVDRFGWPRADTDGRHVTDAVWLLLQHCDLHNDAREDVLLRSLRQWRAAEPIRVTLRSFRTELARS